MRATGYFRPIPPRSDQYRVEKVRKGPLHASTVRKGTAEQYQVARMAAS